MRPSGIAVAVGIPAVLVMFAMLARLIASTVPMDSLVRFGGFTGGSAKDVGNAIFRQYLLPFEVISVLVLIAILGAVVLARKEMD